MNEQQKLTIVCCANDKFATGLIMSLASCLAQSSGKYVYDLVVLDGGLKQKSKQRLEDVLAKVHLKTSTQYTLNYVEPQVNLIETLPTRAGTWMTYARFLLAECLNAPFVIYLDSDILCMRGVEEFYENWDQKAAVTAARDPIEFAHRDWPLKSDIPNSSHYYFNAGLILMNLDWFRQHLPLAKVTELIEQLGLDNLKFHDQTILNYATQNQSIEVPRENNWVLATKYSVQVLDKYQQLNMHYVGRVKPWLRSKTQARRLFPEMLYQLAAQYYGIGNVDKRELDNQDLQSVKAKAKWYKYIKPSRARIYQQVLDNIERTDTIISQIKEADFYYRPIKTNDIS